MEKREFVAQTILHAISSRLIGLGDNESEASYPVEPLPPGLDLTGEGSECES